MDTIYYFSGTGNSLYAAQKTAKALGKTDLKSIIQENRKSKPVISGDTVGFVLPVYFLGIPLIVKEFIEKAEWKQPKYLFLIATVSRWYRMMCFSQESQKIKR